MKQIFPIVVDAATRLGVDTDLGRAAARSDTADPGPAAHRRGHPQAGQDGGRTTGDGNTCSPTPPTRRRRIATARTSTSSPSGRTGLVGDTSPQYDLAKLTYTTRKFRNSNTWTYDPIQAARLDLSSEVASTLQLDAATHSQYANGLAAFSSSLTEPYDETVGVVALTVNESLATDYDGLLRTRRRSR